MPATARTINTASTPRTAGQPRGTGRYQASATGTTTRAPAKSPSTHVRQTSGTARVPMTSPRSSDSEPTVALTVAPAAIAITMRPRLPTLPSGAPRGISRRISSVATSTSSRLPKVWPTAEPVGSAE